MEDDATFPSGAPCWIDTDQPDTDAARRFYGDLFGWTFDDAPPPAPPGSYAVARLGEHDLGGLAATDGAVRWTVYVAVADLDATLSRVEALDGQVLAGPEEAGPAGRSARLADPGGAELGLWEPGRRTGSDVTDTPGAWTTPVLRTSEVSASLIFYEHLFGWRSEPVEGDGQQTSALFVLPGYGEGGADDEPYAVARLVHAPEGAAAAWYPTLAVDDLEAAVARAVELGATRADTAFELPDARRQLLHDPQGAVFAVGG